MTIADLIYQKDDGLYITDALLKGTLIALDAKDGKILFDTTKNKSEYIAKYAHGKVDCLWADVRKVESVFGDYFKPVTKCYVLHDSWK